jgi:hypothetical protein
MIVHVQISFGQITQFVDGMESGYLLTCVSFNVLEWPILGA